MTAVFLGGHPAIDFLNTSFAPAGALTEVIGDGESFLSWLVDAQLLSAEQAKQVRRVVGRSSLDDAAHEARALRDWAVGWIDRWSKHPRASYAPELAHLNRVLQRARAHDEVVATKAGFTTQRHIRIDSAHDLLVLPAQALAALVTSEDASLVKHCAGEQCTLRFVDRTRAHSRMFCSAQACGNRAKVEAFRERQRAKARS
jgi:predicted RNA-binding Zn ribbon-like protein